MKSLVVYATRTGCTKLVAEAIADVLRERGDVQLLDAAHADATVTGADLVVIGGPTERHTLTAPVVRFLDSLAGGSLQDRMFASFDTRLHWPRFLSGSAAGEIATRLGAMGPTLVVPPESFFVKPQADSYVLAPGEIARARTWAAGLADTVDASRVAEV